MRRIKNPHVLPVAKSRLKLGHFAGCLKTQSITGFAKRWVLKILRLDLAQGPNHRRPEKHSKESVDSTMHGVSFGAAQLGNRGNGFHLREGIVNFASSDFGSSRRDSPLFSVQLSRLPVRSLSYSRFREQIRRIYVITSQPHSERGLKNAGPEFTS